MRRSAFVVAMCALLAAGFATALGYGAPRSCGPVADNPWSGTWSTTYGTMELTQCRTVATGDYSYRNGHVHGSVSGNVFTGTWDQDPTHEPPTDAGDVQFTLSGDGRSFTGRWRYGSTGSWQSWNGTLQSGETTSAQATTTTAAAAATTGTTTATDVNCPNGGFCVFILTNVADPGNIWIGSSASVRRKRTCDFADGGRCKNAGGSDTPVTYDVKSPPFPTCAKAIAFYRQNAKNPHAAFGGTKVYIFGGSYFIDNEIDWCSGGSGGTGAGSSKPISSGIVVFKVDAPLDFHVAIAPPETVYLARRSLSRYLIVGNGRVEVTAAGSLEGVGTISFDHERKVGSDENLTLTITGTQRPLTGPSTDPHYQGGFEEVTVFFKVDVTRSNSASCAVGQSGRVFVHAFRYHGNVERTGDVSVFLCGQSLAFSGNHWAFHADDHAVLVSLSGRVFA